MKSNKTGSLLAVASAMLLIYMGGGSGAFADEEVRSERVKFQDLNVETPEGVQALYNRIHAAAKHVCTETDPVLRGAEGICARKAEGDAIAKLNMSQLTAYYKTKTKAGDHTQPLVAAR
jgi:UrcA family protein